jgi:glycosyltransferase involved in cell wall biosynthesis
MKILHITPFYKPHLGGVETHVEAISQELIKRGHEVSILTQRHSPYLSLQEKKDGIFITRIDTESRFYTKLNYKLAVWKQVARQAQLLLKADIIQVHDVYWWLIFLSPLFWSKTYLTFHGWEGQYPIPKRKILARWLWSKLALKTVHVGDYIREFYYDRPDLVIYGGVNVSKKLPIKKNKKFQIIFVGRLETENNIEKYLKLAQELKINQKLEITWVGDGSYKQKCQKLGKVTGMVKNVSSYLATANLVWAASYLSILEAQSQGKIVCAFYDHLLKKRYLETYPGSAHMLVETDIKQMKEQILNLLEKPQVSKKFSQQAKNWTKQQTWSKVTNDYLNLWGIK